jgi:hypothetical protein
MLGYGVIAVVAIVFVAWLVGGLVEDRTRRR